MKTSANTNQELAAENARLRERLQVIEAQLAHSGNPEVNTSHKRNSAGPGKQHAEAGDFGANHALQTTDELLDSSQQPQSQALAQSTQPAAEREHFLQRMAAFVPGVLYVFEVSASVGPSTGNASDAQRTTHQTIPATSPNLPGGWGRAITSNCCIEQQLGFSHAELLAIGVDVPARLMHPDDLARFAQHLEKVRALADGEVEKFEYRMRDRDGSWHWFVSSDAVFERDGNAAARKLIGVASKVTEQVATEKHPEATGATLNRLMASAPVGIALLDADMRYVHINSVLADMNGLSVNAHLGKTLKEVLPGLYDQAAPFFRQVFESGVAATDILIEGESQAIAGLMQAWQVTWFAVAGGNGQTVGVGVFVHEITAQREAEILLKAVENAEKQADQKIVALMENLTEGLCTFDADFRFTYINAAAEKINGLARCDVLGRTQWEVYPASLGTTLEQHLRRAMTERVTIEFENHYAPWDRWYALKAYPASGDGLCVMYRDITQAKRSAEARLRAEERLRRVFDTQTVGIIEWDFDRGILTAANQHFLDMMGYTREDVAAERLSIQGLTPPEWTVINQERIATLRKLGRAPAYEKEYFRKDGSRVPILIAGVCFENSTNEGMSVIIDLTQSKLAEKALRASEERFRMAVAAVSSIVWTNNALGMMTGEQLQWAAFTGQNKQSYQGYGWAKAVHPDDSQPTIDAWNQAVARKQMFAFEHRVRRHDGQWRVCSIRAAPVLDAQGNIVEWVGVHTDITEQRLAEMNLKASEARYRRLFETAKDGILIVDAKSARIIEANPFMADLLGYLPEQLAGKELWQIGLFPNAKACRAALRDINSKRYLRMEDLRVQTMSGKPLRVELVSHVYNDKNEDVIQCNIRDISDRKQLEKNLRQQAAELSLADRRKDAFLATLAHELRNPLAPIRNGLQVMKMVGNDTDTLEKTRTMIERQLAQLVHLVDDLLDVSRISRGKIELRNELIELAAVLGNAVETSLPLIEAKAHVLTVSLPDQPVTLNADMTRLSQVFSNLLNNAAKYSEPGGKIHLHAEVKGNKVAVRIKDNGAGISPDMLPRIFEMFTQVDRTLEKSQGGLGIGLSLVKQLVHLHGGTVHAMSDGHGLGSEFVVSLPVVLRAAETVKLPRHGLEHPAPALPSGRHRILVADDNADAASSLAMFLEILGHEVRVANDGVQAVEVAREFQPVVVLLDIGMPGLNGYDACRSIREQPWGKSAFLIAVTGWGQEEDRRRSEAAGFDHHLVKPMDPAALEALLASRQVSN